MSEATEARASGPQSHLKALVGAQPIAIAETPVPPSVLVRIAGRHDPPHAASAGFSLGGRDCDRSTLIWRTWHLRRAFSVKKQCDVLRIAGRCDGLGCRPVPVVVRQTRRTGRCGRRQLNEVRRMVALLICHLQFALWQSNR